MLNITKKIFTVAGIVFGLVFLLLILLQFWLFTDHARFVVQNGVNDSIPGQISCEALNLSLFSGSLDLRNILIKDLNDETVVSADHIYANISWLSLIKSEIAVEKLVLRSPGVFLQMDQDGNLNLLDALVGSGDKESETSSGGFPSNIHVNEFIISGGIFQFDMADSTDIYAVRDIGLSLKNGNFMEQSGHFLIQTGTSSANMPELDAVIDGLKLEGLLHGGMLNIKSLLVNADDFTLDVTGNVEDTFSSPVFDLSVDLETSLSKIREIFKISTELTGSVKLHLKASGKADNPDALLIAHYGSGVIAGTHVEKLNLECSLKDRQVTISDANTLTPVGALNLTGTVNLRKVFFDGFLSQEQDFDAISYDVFLKQSHVGLEDLLGEDVGVAGSLNSILHLKGSGVTSETVSLNGKLDMRVNDFVYENVLSPMEFNLLSQATYEKGGIRLSNLDLSTGDIHLLVAGEYDLASDAINAMLTLHAPDIAKIKWASGIIGATGKFDLKAGMSGMLNQPKIEANLTGESFGYEDVAIGRIDCSATLDQNGVLEILKLNLENKGAILEGSGNIRVFDNGLKLNPELPGDMVVTFQDVDIQELLKDQLVSGLLNGAFAYKGTVNAPEATLSLKGKALGIKDKFTGDIDANLQFKKGKLIIEKVSLMNGNSLLDISGSMHMMNQDTGEFVGDPAIDVSFTGTSLFIEDFFQEIKGDISLTGQVKGSVKRPHGTITLSGKKIDTGVQTIDDALVSISLDGETVNIDTCAITLVPGEKITAEGWVELLKQEYDLKVLSEVISLDSIDFIRDAVSLTGRLELDVSGKGSFDNPDIDGRVKAVDLHYGENKFDDFHLDLGLKNKLMSVAGNLGFDIGAWFNIDSMDFKAKADFHETSLRPMLEILGRKDLSGILTGGVEAEGNARKPEMIRAVADIKDFLILQDEVELIRAEAFSASLENKTIKVPGLLLNLLNKGRLEFSGKGSLDGSVGFSARGKIPVEVIRVYAEDYTDMTGDIDFSGSIEGTFDQPVIRSDINFLDIGFTVPDLMQKLHGVNGHIEVTPQAVSIEQIRGKLDKGDFKLSGRMNIEKYKPADVVLNFQANALPINVPDTMEFILNTDIAISGTPEASVIEGDIIILEGRYYKDVQLNLVDSVGRRTRQYVPVVKDIILPFLKEPELKINVRHGTPFDIDNNMALMTLRPNLYIHGTVNKPLISGRARVDSGVVTYQNKDFEITKGVVDFINPYKIEPTIELTGQLEIRQWMIYLEVSGTPDNLEFKLTSDPYEDHWNILSLVIFGKTTAELAESGGGTTVSTKQVLADLVAKSLQQNIKDATGVDSFEVKYSERLEEGASDDIKVTVGKELSDRMTLKYGVETKDGVAVQSAITEYKFLEHLLMSAFQDTEGDFGGTLVFRLEFR